MEGGGEEEGREEEEGGVDERTGTVTFVVWNEGSFYWFSLLGLQKLDTPIKGGGRPRRSSGRWILCNEERKEASTSWWESGKCENGRDRIKNQHSAFWSVEVQP